MKFKNKDEKVTKVPGLFSPIQIGSLTLPHRVVMAPMTRLRSGLPGDIPTDQMAEMYAQRASDRGLIITEGASVSITGRGYLGAPGIYSDDQAVAWKKVTDSVHQKGGHIFLQLWHVGRQSHVDVTNGEIPVAPSVVPFEQFVATGDGWVLNSPHRALEIEEIPGIIEEFRNAAELAKAAGFDGVEIHGANGYLPDQFLQDGTNKRNDAYGGTVQNRARFLLEVTEAVVSIWGSGRVGVRISPSGTYGSMSDSNPEATFGYVAEQLNKFDLAYLHVIEPRVSGITDVSIGKPPVAACQLRKLYKGVLIAAGGFTPDSAREIVEKGDADMVAFGRLYISNPDLAERIRLRLPLNPYDRDTFYSGDSHGYIDYPSYKEELTE